MRKPISTSRSARKHKAMDMNFQKLKRTELQTLCKINHIYANGTNANMAKSLKDIYTCKNFRDYKRIELQFICKMNKLHGTGTNDAMIDSLIAFEISRRSSAWQSCRRSSNLRRSAARPASLGQFEGNSKVDASGAPDDTQEMSSYEGQALPILLKIKDLSTKVQVIRKEHIVLCNEVKGITADSLICSETFTALQNFSKDHELELLRKKYLEKCKDHDLLKEECELLQKMYLEELSERKRLHYYLWTWLLFVLCGMVGIFYLK